MNLARRIKAAHPGQERLQDRDVGPTLAHHGDRLHAVSSLTNHLEPVQFEQGPRALAHDMMISEQHPHRIIPRGASSAEPHHRIRLGKRSRESSTGHHQSREPDGGYANRTTAHRAFLRLDDAKMRHPRIRQNQ